MKTRSFEERCRDILSKASACRQEIRRLRNEMCSCLCQHELGAELAMSVHESDWHRCIQDSRDPPSGDDFKPCWRGRWEGDGCGSNYVCVGDDRDGGWCDPCRARQKLRAPLSQAKLRLSGLMSQLWRLAATVAPAPASTPLIRRDCR